MILFILILLFPLLILAAIVLFLTFGIVNLVKGFSRNKDGERNPARITIGFVLLGLAYLVIAGIVVLLAYIAAHPIAFM